MQVQDEVRKFISENFMVDEKEPPAEEDSLLERGIIDSTGVLELVAFIEETYFFKVQDEEMIPENLDSISNICRYIRAKLNDRTTVLEENRESLVRLD